MAAKSDGRSVVKIEEEQPIDLSQAPRKPSRLMPPLIPISTLRAGLNISRVYNNTATTKLTKNPTPLLRKIQVVSRVLGQPDYSNKCNKFSNNLSDTVKVEQSEIYEEDQKCSSQIDCGFNNSITSRKRCHLESDEDKEDWPAKRLDRARSVPQLAPFPFPLERHKSLSESRIPTTSASSSQQDLTEVHGSILRNIWGLNPSECDSKDEWQKRLELAASIDTSNKQCNNNNNNNNDGDDDSWVYVGYYSQLLHKFQEQELLRQCALQHHKDEQGGRRPRALLHELPLLIAHDNV
uniref:Uncharacterized protein n=1 Tax=Timema bartmani TaxID=61472 RepID=A0A7R9F1C8_9NEOP|nr:unnamed protein product [Timema bartmani]